MAYNEGVWPGIYYSIGCGGGLILAGLLTAREAASGGKAMYRLTILPGATATAKASVSGPGSAMFPASWNIHSPAAGLRRHPGGLWHSLRAGVVITAVVILIYCTIGGMWGVVLTDVDSDRNYYCGYSHTGHCHADSVYACGRKHCRYLYDTVYSSQGMGTKFIYLVLPFFLSISVSYDAYARIQSAKDAKTATKGCIWGGVYRHCHRASVFHHRCGVNHTVPRRNRRYFTIAATGVLHPVLAGIVIAAILSAAMSSANCVILSLGASFPETSTINSSILGGEPGRASEGRLISRAAVFGGSIVGILFAFKMTDILDAMIIFNYPYMGSMLVPLLGGLLWKGATRKGAFAAAIAGGIVGVVSFFIGIPGPLYGIINVDLSLMIAYLVSAAALVIFSSLDKDGKKYMCKYGRGKWLHSAPNMLRTAKIQ